MQSLNNGANIGRVLYPGVPESSIKLSIVLPVYKVERYIDYCLHSIFSSFKEDKFFELIIVDDGSPDKSMDIAKRSCGSHNNVKYVEQNNKGLSAARMEGAKYAQGEYIWFIDSDDWIYMDAFSSVRTLIMDGFYDVITSPLSWINDNDNSLIKNDIELKSDSAQVVSSFDYVKNNYPLWAIQRYIFKRRLFDNPGLYFPLHKYHEDAYFARILICISEHVIILHNPIYCYRIRFGSIMTTPTIKSSYDLIDIHRLLNKYFIESHNRHIWKEIMNNCFNGTIYESYAFNRMLIGKKEFRHFLLKNRPYIILEYLKCPKFIGIKENLGNMLFLLMPKLYISIFGEIRYFSI